MRKENIYTGEVVDTSPGISSVNEIEAANMASFGKYDYDPGMRLMSQPTQIYPGAYGYNTNPNFSYGSPIGIGANPYMNNTWQNNFNYGYNTNPYANPVFNYQQQPQYEVPKQCFIQPVNFSGEFLPPMDFEEQIQNWKMEFWNKEQVQTAKDSVERNNIGYGNPYYSGNNYYGVPYYNPYSYNNYNSEVANLVHEMEEEARANRRSLNQKLSKLAHNIVGDSYGDNDIREIYEGKYVDTPISMQVSYNQAIEYNRFANLVPFDNSGYYREHSAAVSREYNSIIPQNANMKECFDNSSMLHFKQVMDEEDHKRKNGALLYNSEDNSYKYFVRAKAAERYAKEKNQPVSYGANSLYDAMNPIYQNQNMFPTLSQSIKLCEDGSLNITCNFGSKAGQTYSVHNSQEANYNENRARFQSFIDSIPGSSNILAGGK